MAVSAGTADMVGTAVSAGTAGLGGTRRIRRARRLGDTADPAGTAVWDPGPVFYAPARLFIHPNASYIPFAYRESINSVYSSGTMAFIYSNLSSVCVYSPRCCPIQITVAVVCFSSTIADLTLFLDSV